MVCAEFAEAFENRQYSKRHSPKHRGQIYYYYSFLSKTLNIRSVIVPNTVAKYIIIIPSHRKPSIFEAS
jgi:hypothetical protein